MQVNKAFLEKCLKEPISSFTLSSGAKAGDNIAGSLEAIKVTLETGKIVHLVNKTFPDDLEAREFIASSQIFVTETTVYDTVLPRVEAVLKSNGSDPGVLSLTPRYIAGKSGADCDPDEQFLLLEDVRPDGYIMQDKFKCYDLPEVTLVLKELARFHASTYFWMRQEGEKIFEESPGMKQIKDTPMMADDDPIMVASGTEMFQGSMTNAVSILKESGYADLAQKVKAALAGPDTSINIVKKRRERTDNTTFACIIHGDLWVNNIMIKYDSKGKPEGLKLLDLQMTRRGNIYEDLIYFIYTSTLPEFRKNHLLQALNTYYESFVATLDQLKCPVPVGFTRGVLIDTFHEEMFGGFIFMFFAIPLQLTEPLKLYLKEEIKVKHLMDHGQLQGDGPPPDFDPSKMSMDQIIQMIKTKLGINHSVMKAQMQANPRAIERMVSLTKEAVEMKLL